MESTRAAPSDSPSGPVGESGSEAAEARVAGPGSSDAAGPSGLRAPWSDVSWELLHGGRNDTKGCVWEGRLGERRLICKDLGSRALRPVAGLRRRWALRNEIRALRLLDSVPGVPRLLDDWPGGVIMEWVPGTPLAGHDRKGVAPEVLDRFAAIVAAVHAKDVVIGDLHWRNVLVGDRGEVHLVDFELAQDRRHGLGRWVGGYMSRRDLFSVARLRRRYGAPLSDEQQALLDKPPFWRSGYRRLKRGLRNLGRRVGVGD